MKKTYITTMPNHIGAFLRASECFAELGVNITRVSYNKAVDSHTLFIDAEGTEAQLKAGIDIREIGYINAHATSTHIGDTNEAKAIYNIFGDQRTEVTSTKSQTGHEMWMAGASEIVYSMLMMKNGFIAANLNFENPDEDSAKLLIPAKRVEKHFDTFLSNSFGFGGTNSTLIVRDWK